MDPFIGQIQMVGFNFAPQGWALCNGQVLPISQYSALFALIGTYYGGNGTSNFALPNLQGRVPIHQGQSPGTSQYVIGQSDGVETVTLQTNNMPIHTHAANCHSEAGSTAVPTGNFWAEVNDGGRTPVLNPAYSPSSNAQLASAAIGMAGGNVPFGVVQPYQCVNFIIALVGIFPSRG